MSATLSTTENRQLGALGSRTFMGAGIIGLIALAITAALGSSAGWTIFWKSYLVGFMVVLGVSLGGLFFTILQHIVKAGWSVTVRRIAEGFASNLRWIWVLFLPILGLVLTGNGDLLYDWANAEYMHSAHALEQKAAYLNVAFWSIRAVAYFGIWAVLAHFYVSRSIAQDTDHDVRHTVILQRLAPIAMILYALTQSYAAIDWLMSLQAMWFSTMFAVYYFAASACGFFATLIFVIWRLQASGRICDSINVEHFQDMGKLLFAFGVVFWAYIGYSQYMLIWYANIPIETQWFMARQLDGWFWVSMLL